MSRIIDEADEQGPIFLGADALKAALETTRTPEPSPVLTALRELVACKDLRGRADAMHQAPFPNVSSGDAYVEVRDEYERRMPLAWEAARAALATRTEPGPLTEAQIDEYLENYETEYDAGSSAPSDEVKFVIKDAIMGLLAPRTESEPTPALARAADMLTAYAEMVKATGKYAEEHYIPEIEFVIEQLRAPPARERASEPESEPTPAAVSFSETAGVAPYCGHCQRSHFIDLECRQRASEPTDTSVAGTLRWLLDHGHLKYQSSEIMARCALSTAPKAEPLAAPPIPYQRSKHVDWGHLMEPVEPLAAPEVTADFDSVPVIGMLVRVEGAYQDMVPASMLAKADAKLAALRVAVEELRVLDAGSHGWQWWHNEALEKVLRLFDEATKP